MSTVRKSDWKGRVSAGAPQVEMFCELACEKLLLMKATRDTFEGLA